MRNIARNRAHAARNKGAGGFLVWIAAYAVFMVALIAFSVHGQRLDHDQPSWQVVAFNR